MSSSGYPLRCHIDSENSTLPTMSAVVGLNMLHMSGQRRGCDGYSRISIDRTMNREDCDLPLVEHIADSYNTFPADQRNITNNLLKGPAVKLLGGFSFIRNPCNMDPLSYHLSFTHCILLLVHHFNLGFSEAIGVQCAMDFLHHTSLIFVTACKCVLSCLPTSMFRKFRPGYKLGYEIVRLMKVLYERKSHSHSQQGPKHQTYSCNKSPILPDWKEWFDKCHHRVVMALRAFSCYKKGANRKTKQLWYKKLLEKFTHPNSENMAMNTSMAVNISMAVIAQIGLLPSWVHDFAVIDPTCHYIKFVSDKFYHGVSLKTPDLNRIMETLRTHMCAHRFGEEFTVKKTENIFSQIFRYESNNNDRGWCDLLDRDQNLYYFCGDTVKIFHKGLWTKLPGTAIVDRWPFGSDLSTPQEMVAQLGLGSKSGLGRVMPSDDNIKQLVHQKTPVRLQEGYNVDGMDQRQEEVLLDHQ